MHPSFASLVVFSLLLAAAPGAWGQDPLPLEYSRRSMLLLNLEEDTVQIRNPNAFALRCDSVVLLFKDKSFLSPLIYSSHGEGVTRAYHPFGGAPWHPDTGNGVSRVYFYDNTMTPSKSIKIDFPAGRTVNFTWIGYDPCPMCKRSAAPASADSLHFRMVFHIGGMTDTLQMTISDRWRVGIAHPLRENPARPQAGPRRTRDPLGRWRSKPEACLPTTCYQGNW